MDELDEKMKFLEIAEKILARKNQIVEIKNSISTLMDDFTKNWKIDGPQALRWVFFLFCRSANLQFLAIIFISYVA